MSFLPFLKHTVALEKYNKWDLADGWPSRLKSIISLKKKDTSAKTPALKISNLTCRLPHRTDRKTRPYWWSRQSTAMRKPSHTSRDITKKQGRTTQWETQDTQGKEGWHCCRAWCLHFDQIPIFKCVVRVTLQGREVANTVIDWDAGGKGNA